MVRSTPRKHPPQMKPDKAYVGHYLWLPRSKVNEKAIKSVLTLSPPAPPVGKAVNVTAFEMSGHHIRVPRHFYPREKLEEWLGSDNIIYCRLPVWDHQTGWYSKGEDIEPRNPSQARAIEALADSEGGILELGCGKGKTVSMLAEVKRAKVPTLIVVNNTTLINQWKEECERWLGMTPTIVRGPKRDFSNLTIAMLHTLAQNPPSDEEADKYGIIVFDECHHLSAPTFNAVCPMFQGYRFGLTATKRREDGMENLYLYHLGPVLYSDLSTELEPEVFFIQTGVQLTPQEIQDIKSTEDMINVSRLRSLLAQKEDRNTLILQEIEKALAIGRRILVLGHIVSHLEYLSGEIPGAGLCVGKVAPKKRHKILEECDVVFGTTSLVAEGLDAPWLDTLFIITPMKGKGLFQQALGRILRVHPGKKDPIASVFEDKFRVTRTMTRSLRKYLKDHDISFHSVEGGK